MFKGIKGVIALAAAGLLVVAIAYAGYLASQPDSPAAASSDPAARLRVTLDPNQFQGRVREAYQAAEHDPALLAQMHCYCGCDRDLGHKNLLDCYRDTHGSRCPICVGEANDANSMAGRGVPVEKIRDALRERYAHGS
jgi:hypothetical protein